MTYGALIWHRLWRVTLVNHKAKRIAWFKIGCAQINFLDDVDDNVDDTNFFGSQETCFGGHNIVEKQMWVATIDFVKKSWKSEPSSPFLSRSKSCCSKKSRPTMGENTPLSGEFNRSSQDAYLSKRTSPGRLSQFFEKWRVGF